MRNIAPPMQLIAVAMSRGYEPLLSAVAQTLSYKHTDTQTHTLRVTPPPQPPTLKTDRPSHRAPGGGKKFFTSLHFHRLKIRGGRERERDIFMIKKRN